MTDLRGSDSESAPWYEVAAGTGPAPELGWVDDPWDDPPGLTSAETSRPTPRARLVKRILLAVVALALVGALVIGAVGLWVIVQINPPGERGEAATFVVEQGDDLVSVSTRLRATGFIRHSGVFQWYAKRNGGLEPEPGYYTLRPLDTMGNLAAALRRSPNATFTSVTFPEGYTVAQMAARLAVKVPRLRSDQFLAATRDGEVTSEFLPPGIRSLEGLLFPDTYQVSNAESERQVVARMLRLTERVGRQEGLDDPLLRGPLSPYQVLIVASLIEREARFDEDRPRIARVILNRLELGMRLEIDASLYYGHDPRTPFATLRRLDTPYNTYVYPGLPPTPIANPGRASIRAALNPSVDPSPGDPICRSLLDPTKCRYLYYVLSDKAGHHVFGATPEQHDENVKRARAAGLLS